VGFVGEAPKRRLRRKGSAQAPSAELLSEIGEDHRLDRCVHRLDAPVHRLDAHVQPKVGLRDVRECCGY
jgi:hypothetical protein